MKSSVILDANPHAQGRTRRGDSSLRATHSVRNDREERRKAASSWTEPQAKWRISPRKQRKTTKTNVISN